jgi:hypothetical protein
MLITDGKIRMSDAEWREFAEATFAPWVPRTPREFNAMVDLGIARHLAENTDGQGFMHQISLEAMKFGENGEANFPLDMRRMAYVKVHGTWPTDDELRSFEAQGGNSRPTLTLVK